MVKNVAKPPRISRPKVEPRSEILKNRSSPFTAGGAALGRGTTFCGSGMTRLLVACWTGADAGWIVPLVSRLQVFSVLRNRRVRTGPAECRSHGPWPERGTLLSERPEY